MHGMIRSQACGWAKMEEGAWKIPARHSDDGWCDYREPKRVAGFERNRVLLYLPRPPCLPHPTGARTDIPTFKNMHD